MKITAAHITNFKRIKDIKIRPGADRTLMLIGGKNAQGKSSVLDALTAAFGGKRSQPLDPVRHGAEAAEIIVELDGGLTVRRVIAPDGESTLEVRDELGSVKAPQTVLEKLVAGRFLDPLQFLAQSPKDQRAQLMRLIEGADRIAGLNEKKDRAFAKRTEVGRDLTKAKGELERLVPVDVGTPIDVAALNEEARTLGEIQRAGDGLGHALSEAETLASLARSEEGRAKTNLDALEEQLAQLQQRIDKVRSALPALASVVADREAAVDAAKAKLDEAAKQWAAVAPRRDQIDAEARRADEHNRAIYEAQASNRRRAETADTVAKLSKEYEDLSKVIETIDTRKSEILSAAKLPVEGLGIGEDGITLNGVPFEQASAAERLRVALGLAIAASPKLGDVWIRDGALLDEESLDLVAKHATAAGCRVWIERVGTNDPGVIVIQDGRVAS